MNPAIRELEAKRAALNSQIRAAKEQERKTEASRAGGDYVKTVCHECRGDGDEKDHRSPAILGACCGCNGRGYIWRRRWEKKQTHDMSHEGKEGTYPTRKQKE